MCVCVSLSVSPWLRNLPVTAFNASGSILRLKEILAVLVAIKNVMHFNKEQLAGTLHGSSFCDLFGKI